MKIVHLLKTSLLLLISGILLCWGIVNVYIEFAHQVPRQTMEYWNCIGKVDNQDSWRHQAFIMDQMVHLSPFDAQIHTDIARLYEWQATNGEAWSENALTARDNAIRHFRSSTELSPTRANGWINLLKSKSINQQFGGEVIRDFSNALRYGKNQTGIQSQLIWLGLGMWDSLDEPNKLETKELIKRLLESHKKKHYILTTAFRFNWVNELKKLTADPQLLAQIDHLENNPSALAKALSPQTSQTECRI
ncbi:MAG: hypothetical protein OEM38_09000 [Gammaproteobacteria bacterium]|nr:hypothetical protein [Gammaproteobacteria bacterium]